MNKHTLQLKVLFVVAIYACILGCMGGGGSDRAGGGIEGSGVRDFELEGTIVDNNNRPLQGVKVSIENDISGEPVSTTTDINGNFVVVASLALDEPALVVFEGFNQRTQIELPKESVQTVHVKIQVKLKKDYEIEEVDVLPPTSAPTPRPEPTSSSDIPQTPSEPNQPVSSVTPSSSALSSSQAGIVSSSSSSSAESSSSLSSTAPAGNFSSLNDSADLGPGIPD